MQRPMPPDDVEDPIEETTVEEREAEATPSGAESETPAD